MAAIAVGWLVDSGFCCTSYPIQLMLVVYTPEKPLRHFTGDGGQFSDGASLMAESELRSIRISCTVHQPRTMNFTMWKVNG